MAESNTDFMRMQQQAVERMREMSNRSTSAAAHQMPPAPSFVKVENRHTAQKTTNENAPLIPKNEPISTMHKNGNPFSLIQRLHTEPDMALIIGLLLILWSEKSDKRLLLALLYILF